jgi:hypothetical protein
VGFGVGSVLTGNAISFFCDINMLFYTLMFFGFLLLVSIVPFPIRAEPIPLMAGNEANATNSNLTGAEDGLRQLQQLDQSEEGLARKGDECEERTSCDDTEEDGDDVSLSSASNESWSGGEAQVVIDQQQKFWEEIKVIVKVKNLPLMYVFRLLFDFLFVCFLVFLLLVVVVVVVGGV